MDTIQFGIGTGTPLLVLQGAGVAVPVRGAFFRESRRSADGVGTGSAVIEDTLDVVLEGTAVQIEDCLRTMARELVRAESEADLPAGAFRYLEARARDGGELLRSKMLGGWVELLEGGAGYRANGATGARLHVRRVDYWEAALRYLPLSIGGASGVTTGLTVYNHSGSLAYQDNTAAASGADAPGELPAPALLVFNGVDTTDIGTLYVGQAVNAPGGSMSFEGEAGITGAGVTGTDTVAASASSGNFRRLAWSGTGEVALWRKDFDPFDMYAFGGRPFLPVMRLHAFTAEALWFYWRVTVNFGSINHAAYDSPGGWLSVNRHHCAGAPVFLPPWPVGSGDLPPGVGLELRVKASAAGAHTLDLDCLHLLPLDRWRVYRPSVGSYSGLKITDDPYSGTLKSGDWAIQMHQTEGPGLTVVPERSNRWYFLMEKAGGGFPAGTRGTVRIAYRPRYRGL